MMKEYFLIQKKMDIEDIKLLWESSVERNPVIKFAPLAELVDAPDLGSGIERCAGSSPVPGTFHFSIQALTS